MVEFRFNIRPLFAQPIVRVSSSLLPHTFRGDRRQALDATSKMSEIIDKMGQLSAVSQKLNKPITTAQRLRMADNQILYLLADVKSGNNGSVIGLLKIGTKDLYLFDETGQTRKIENVPCILDFYIHESRQRAGLGKDMFETMLNEENWTPLKCSVDRPSDKLLGFLKKHYGLVRTIPQANNFVLYEGFFDGNGVTAGGDAPEGRHRHPHQQRQQQHINGLQITNSPNTQLFGAHYVSDEAQKRRTSQQQDAPNVGGAQVTQISPVGRYGARRPTCSMAEKTGSEVSLSPSQAAEQAKLNSGLQDVDDEYMKNNVFSRQTFPRHSGLADDYGTTNQARIMNMNAPQPPLTQTESTFKLKTGADGAVETPSQNPMHAQAQMQQSQMHSNAQPPPQQQKHQQQQLQGHMHGQQQQQQQQQQQIQQQQYQQQQQSNAHGQPSQMQCKNQTFNANQPNIIHSSAATPRRGDTESSSLTSPQDINDAIEALGAELQDFHTNTHQLDGDPSVAETAADCGIIAADVADMTTSAAPPDAVAVDEHVTSSPHENHRQMGPPSVTDSGSDDHFMNMKKPANFHLSKQHTGMKNMSYGVGMAVTPTNKMEFDQEAREEFGVVKINRPVGSKLNSPTAQPEQTDAMSTVSSSGEGLTDQGYYDLKFYHNKLW